MPENVLHRTWLTSTAHFTFKQYREPSKIPKSQSTSLQTLGLTLNHKNDSQSYPEHFVTYAPASCFHDKSGSIISLREIIRAKRIDKHKMGKCDWCGHYPPKPCVVYKLQPCSRQCGGEGFECLQCKYSDYPGYQWSDNDKTWISCDLCNGSRRVRCFACHESSGTKRVLYGYCNNELSAHSTDYAKYPINRCNTIFYNSWYRNRMNS